MKVLLKQIGSNWYSFLTVRRDRAMFGDLSGDAQFPHEASDTFLTTWNSLCMQFSMNPWASVHASIVLKSRLDLRRKGQYISLKDLPQEMQRREDQATPQNRETALQAQRAAVEAADAFWVCTCCRSA